MYFTYTLPRLTPLKFRKDLQTMFRRVLRGEPCQVELRLELEDLNWSQAADAYNAFKEVRTALINNTAQVNALTCTIADLPYAAFRLHEIKQSADSKAALPHWPSPQENTAVIYHITRTDLPEPALKLLKAIHLY